VLKNFTLSEIFRLIAPFYRVADFLLGRPINTAESFSPKIRRYSDEIKFFVQK
jgi:hypothetical protein